jgi:hypothetical protein
MVTMMRCGLKAAQVLLGVTGLAAPVPAACSEGQAFVSRRAAEAYLARELPVATAANPKYRDPNTDLDTRWLTESISFTQAVDGGVVVTMREVILKYRGAKIVDHGIHSAEFPIEVTGVGLISDAWVPVDSVDAAAGILFRCPEKPCIRTHRNGKSTIDIQTDITISNRESRTRLYEAFRALRKESGLP